MLRFSRPLFRVAERCHYDVLGVARTASTDEIKSAFRRRAKETHPDASETAAGSVKSESKEFRQLVDAYRVLRDEKQRREYDRRKSGRGNVAQDRPGERDWRGGRGAGEAAASADPARSPLEGYALAAVVLSGGAFLAQMSISHKEYKDHDPHPRQLPARVKHLSETNTARATLASSKTPLESRPGAEIAVMAKDKVEGSGFAVPGALEANRQDADRLVRAYWDPFFEKWYKIPEGFQAPSGMDLTAWHNKRTDPVEWSRLHAEGRLSQIIPRGGLQERYLPAWETFEPILIGDPVSGKTMRADQKIAVRTQEKCEVQF
jgi:curved DNA-binding protein CbpA